jgi:uncharacterized membrane protein
MNARAWFGWIVLTLAIAAAVHVGSIYAIPYAAMELVTSRMGSPNTMHQQSRPTATSRVVVRPSPDLLYSACSYDLSNGPIEVKAVIPTGTYWSVSAFDNATNNWLVRNDKQLPVSSVDLVIEPPDQDREVVAARNRIVVKSPTVHGLVLIRTLINDESHFQTIDRTRRQSSCGPLASGNSLRH